MTMIWSKRWTALALVLLIAGATAGACAGEGDDASGPASGGSGGEEFRLGEAPARQPEAAAGAPVPGPAGKGVTVQGRSASLPTVGPSVIKTADIRLEVEPRGVEEAVRSATATAGRYGGFVLSTEVEGERITSGRLVIRVPAERFEAALADIGELGKTLGERVSGEDVSEQFIDLEARLRNLRAQESVLLRLMRQASTITGTIRVQNELEGIQLEIERIEGRLRFLSDQTEMGTISVAFTEGAPVPAKPSPLERAWENAVDVTVAVASGAIVAAGFLLPLALLGAVVFLVVRLLRPRFTS